MGKNVLSYAKYFHCSCHATWLPCKTSMAKLSLENKNKDMADQVPLISPPPTPSLLSLFSSSAFIFPFLTLSVSCSHSTGQWLQRKLHDKQTTYVIKANYQSRLS